MSWKQHVCRFDEDTVRLLQIAQDFLIQYFGHEADEAEQVMSKFIEASIWDEDVMHHESSYRLAAAAHYLCALGGDRTALGKWLLEAGHKDAPPAAAEYFREHYFQKR